MPCPALDLAIDAGTLMLLAELSAGFHAHLYSAGLLESMGPCMHCTGQLAMLPQLTA